MRVKRSKQGEKRDIGYPGYNSAMREEEGKIIETLFYPNFRSVAPKNMYVCSDGWEWRPEWLEPLRKITVNLRNGKIYD